MARESKRIHINADQLMVGKQIFSVTKMPPNIGIGESIARHREHRCNQQSSQKGGEREHSADGRTPLAKESVGWRTDKKGGSFLRKVFTTFRAGCVTHFAQSILRWSEVQSEFQSPKLNIKLPGNPSI